MYLSHCAKKKKMIIVIYKGAQTNIHIFTENKFDAKFIFK